MSEGIASLKELGIVVRPLPEVEEMSIGVELQHRVSDYSAIDAVPGQLFVVARRAAAKPGARST
jgi:hypothetical protein